MTDTLDLDAYLARIGYTGPRAPSLEVLAQLHARHATTIPFENLDVLLGRPVRLDLASLQDKLVARRRGGYCFEHNTLFAAALRALGFSLRTLSGRVQWMRPPEAVTPRTHMLLEATLPEGRFLADVGFGGLTMTAPLRLEPEVEQATPHETLRLMPLGGGLQLQARLPAGWSPLYRFDPTTQHPIDYEVANWFTSTHPDSLFRNQLIAGRPEEGGLRHTLSDLDYSLYGPSGLVETRTLSAGELAETLDRTFGLDWPGGPADLAALHARLAGKKKGPREAGQFIGRKRP